LLIGNTISIITQPYFTVKLPLLPGSPAQQQKVTRGEYRTLLHAI